MDNFIVLVCGGRDYNDRERVFGVLDGVAMRLNLTAIVEGGAQGADRLARQWAESRGVPVVEMPALWKFHGDKADVLRNQAMLDIMRPNFVVAFPGGRSTADMVGRARRAGVDVKEVGAVR